MINSNLETMFKGWFIGNFSPTAFSTEACEVAVKKYSSGESEPEHYHKVSTEITLILSGDVIMCNTNFTSGDIIILHPGEVTAFKALTDTVSVVVKIPSSSNDKYYPE